MKLSEIMAYRNFLDSSTPLFVNAALSLKMNPVLTAVTQNTILSEHLTEKLTKEYNDVFRYLGDFECTIEEIKNALQDLIDQNNAPYFAESFKNYEESVNCETVEFILKRKLPIYAEVSDQLTTRIRYYNDWKLVGLILRPGHEDWIQELVGCDPLYLVDTNSELLEPAKLRFNDQYQRRLRTYTIQETIESNMLDQLPDGQFGFCLVYNFFNYKPMEIIEAYLKELYIKLKPGGVVAFTFNNCDRAEGIELFERHFMSYTPEKNLLALCQSIGYEIKNVFRLDQSCTWVEINRPGTLNSLRGGQSLAKIVYNNDISMYTTEDIRNIRQEAIDLKIEKPNVVRNMEIPHLVQLINQRKLQK
jgi:SAM-dependent methyltransferase